MEIAEFKRVLQSGIQMKTRRFTVSKTVLVRSRLRFDT